MSLVKMHGIFSNPLGYCTVLDIPWNSDLSRLGQVRLLGPVSGLTQTKSRVQARTVVGSCTGSRWPRESYYTTGHWRTDMLLLRGIFWKVLHCYCFLTVTVFWKAMDVTVFGKALHCFNCLWFIYFACILWMIHVAWYMHVVFTCMLYGMLLARWCIWPILGSMFSGTATSRWSYGCPGVK